ncbi:HP1 family phage holin [Rahnella sp. PCH160]|uniref:HP1 family phage holin n=1 Tax=Rahnella sp. PCH160 TaxID=3447928 RepID=UPI0039FD9AD9
MGLNTERISSACAYFIATSLTWLAGLTSQDVAFLVGSGVGVGTFLVNWYYRRKSFQLLTRSNLNPNTYEDLNS